MNTIFLYALAIVAIVLATVAAVALSVVTCEWRYRRRKAAEAAAVHRRLDAYLAAEKKKMDRFFESCSPEQRAKYEKWMREIKKYEASQTSADQSKPAP